MASPGNLSSILLPLLLLFSCGSARRGDYDPEIEQSFLEEQARLEKGLKDRTGMARILIDLDRALGEYVANARRSENSKARRKMEAIGKLLREYATRFRGELLGLLTDKDARNRGIAAGVLGFGHGPDLVAPLIHALGDEKPFVKVNACLSLGILASPLTPLDPLNDLLLDSEQEPRVRQGASGTLLLIQLAGSEPENFRRLWTRILARPPLSEDPKVLIDALRGVGHLGDPGHFAKIRPFLRHPLPMVRQAALIATARLGDRGNAREVLPLLTEKEDNPNVRLFARKALQALAGNRVDHEYDIPAWSREFGLPRGSDKGPTRGSKRRP